MKKNHMFSKLLFLSCSALLFAACGGADSATDSSTASADGDLPEKVVIATLEMPNDEGIAKAEGYFEDELGVPVEVVQFESGKAINQAMVSGAVDFGLTGSGSAVLGIASGIPIEMIWIHETLGSVEALAAKSALNATSLEDLKGKNIGVPFASTAHYSLLRAITASGFEETDFTLIDLQPSDIFAAWQRGDIDAAYVWEPTLSELLADGNIVLHSGDVAEMGYMTANVEIVRSEFGEAYPEIVEKYIASVDKAVTLYREDPDQAISIIAKSLNITEESAKLQMEGQNWISAAEQLDAANLGTSEAVGAMAATMLDMGQFYLDQGNITDLPSEEAFAEGINTTYIQAYLDSKE
ncbi:ABC transporter substrate-binding protein [Trichococcus shcherbakoviae]|uniref:Taurine ABC transporter substrate-binding protein n=1 Tax=Trichococcus shcherbakoviae subsp. psychrophilus TaxID=2585775 RepID=A0A5C5E5J8_9LACT|nr:ABC transporter substrate-binding protein [Trichococcus shcherbakoviae]TNV68498.1 taurine ABC transporter substrate-binding protein [Trichococcus shcherbakoviae subsp. psychrophilus]